MRWLRLLAVCTGLAASLARAAVPEALSEAFVQGMTLSVKFGDTLIEDDGTTSAGSITSPPVFTLRSPQNPIPPNTRYTIVLMDITDSRNPTTEAGLHYVASNLKAPSPEGGELELGTVNFEYVPPARDTKKADFLFMVYAQFDGNIELNLESAPDAGSDRLFSVSVFRQDNGFQLADTGVGFTIRSDAASDTSTTLSTSTTSFTFPNTTTTFSSSIPSSTPEETTSFPSNSTTTFSSSSSSSSSETTPPPTPPEQSTSYLTLSGGSTKTIVYTAPNDPGTTLGSPGTTSTTADPSLITNEPSSASQNAVSRSATALLAFCMAFILFI